MPPTTNAARPSVARISSFNVNGIRAAARRGFGDWLGARSPDVVGLQEMRCPADEIPAEAFAGYHLSYHQGEVAGRNGVAIASRVAPSAARYGTGSREFDHEGRYVEVDLELPGLPVTVGSLYLPKGGTPFEDETSMARFERKLRFCAHFGRYLTTARRTAQRLGREFLVMGDFNIAPTALDVHNAGKKVKNEGFLPEETAWLGSQLSPRTLIDVVRSLRPGEQGPYTWWSWRGQQWTFDRGWRIDHQLATPGLAARAVAGGTDNDETYEARMSDHAPVTVDYSLPTAD